MRKYQTLRQLWCFLIISATFINNNNNPLNINLQRSQLQIRPISILDWLKSEILLKRIDRISVIEVNLDYYDMKHDKSAFTIYYQSSRIRKISLRNCILMCTCLDSPSPRQYGGVAVRVHRCSPGDHACAKPLPDRKNRSCSALACMVKPKENVSV